MASALPEAKTPKRRGAHAEQYRPRIRPEKSIGLPQEDPRLVKLTREVLEQLKHPAAVPGRIVMQALKQASALARA
jgi:hypothetical protein